MKIILVPFAFLLLATCLLLATVIAVRERIKSMKTIAIIFAIGALSLSGMAQTATNVSPETFSQVMASAWNNIETNWSVTADYAHNITGHGASLGAVDVVYNINNNVGFIAGYEDLYTRGKSQVSTVAGGVTVKATVHPLSFLGSSFTNKFPTTTYASDLIATPRSGSAIANLAIVGAAVRIMDFSNYELSGNFFYEKRTGVGAVGDGNWVGFGPVLTRKF